MDGYPVSVEVAYPASSSRALAISSIPFFLARMVLAIPAFVVLYFVGLAAVVRAIEFRRHTANEGDSLTPEGIAAARALGERLRGPYHLMISTGAQRATQTLACMLAAMPPQPGVVEVDGAFRSAVEDEWRAAYAEAGTGDLASYLRVAPALVQAETERFSGAARAVFDRLADGERALIVGHSPMHEAAVYGLTGEITGPLGKGGAILVVRENDGYRLDRA